MAASDFSATGAPATAAESATALGDAKTVLEHFVEAGIDAIDLWRGASDLRYALAVQPVASPVHRGTMHASATVAAGGRRWFLQRTLDDVAPLVDECAAAAAATRAGELGVAPRVLARDAATGTVVYEHLPEGSRWCRVDDLAEPTVLDAALAAKRVLHASPPLGAPRDPFAAVEAHLVLAREREVALPGDHAWLDHQVRMIAAAIAAAPADIAPCHGDGAASNVILTPGGEVLLIDFDAAGDADPCYDVGALLLEACETETAIKATLERMRGGRDRATLARCRLYGIVDDVRWGLWGRLAAALSDRPTVEFFKYGEWRLLRARHNLRDRRLAAWLRELRG